MKKQTAAEIAGKAKIAARAVRLWSRDLKDRILRGCATQLLAPEHQEVILSANAQDIQKAKEDGCSPAFIERLLLDRQRLESIARSMIAVSNLEDPIGQIRDFRKLPSGLRVGRMRVPLGVVLFIYESRPNVTLEAAALCIKAGNSVIVRGGSEALQSNTALVKLFNRAMADENLEVSPVVQVETADRELLRDLLRQRAAIDVVVPRGGAGLIDFVRNESSIPALFHAQGICHVYVHRDANPAMAERIIINSKVQRPGVCNSMEGLLIDSEIVRTVAPDLVRALTRSGVEIRGCPRFMEALDVEMRPHVRRAESVDFDTEFLDLTCAVTVVDGLDQAVEFIEAHGTRHTSSIITDSLDAAQRFLSNVDSSCVLVNASTRLNDGFELGLGAELGISTTKLHAYGPMGLEHLCAEKYVVIGDGHTRAG